MMKNALMERCLRSEPPVGPMEVPPVPPPDAGFGGIKESTAQQGTKQHSKARHEAGTKQAGHV